MIWNGAHSQWFHASARPRVRQAGVLSPDFYSLYVDKLFLILENSGIGCYLVHKFAVALMYADDMALLAPSLLCERYFHEWDIKLNASKSKNLSFGKGPTPSHQLTLNSAPSAYTLFFL